MAKPKTGPVISAAYVEEVRVRALRLMEANMWKAADVARPTPYKRRTIERFLAGDHDYQTASIAAAVARAHGELDAGLHCPLCGRMING